jgi:origin recognition complex subunit 5
VSLVLDVFFNACADLSELHHIVELLFPKYLQPIVTDGVKPNEILILYNRIRPFLQDVLKSLSLREISFSDLIKKSQDDPNAKKNVIDLPLSAKYILIASYLASYNNPKYDKQIFGTSHVGKAKKTRRIKNAKEKLQQQFEGPKAFQLNRMLAIYTSIAKGDEDQQDTITSQYVSPTTVQIFTQISSLVGLKLLALDSTSSFNLDKAKYKCCVDLDYIETIANSINFKLYNFLYNE